ncbi:MAG: serine hydrolase domain-containing protein [Phycicoccus sp.]
MHRSTSSPLSHDDASRRSRLSRRHLVAGAVALALPGALVAGPAAGAVTSPAAPTSVAAVSRAESRPDAALRRDLDAMVASGVPGAIAYSRGPGGTQAVASGKADLATGRNMGPRTVFRIGSGTKTFVAVRVLQLVDEGELELDDAVETWLPGVVPHGEDITVRMLLGQRSGLHNYTDDSRVVDEEAGALREPFRRWSARELVAIGVSTPSDFAPGTEFGYSNTNYLLAGLLVERITRRAIEVEVTEHVIRPLGLRDTVFPTAAPGVPTGASRGYVAPAEKGGAWTDATDYDPSWAGAAGAMTSTAPDMARFYRELLGGRLMSSEQLGEMLETTDASSYFGQPTQYGLGIFAQETPCGTAWGHGGDTPDFTFRPYSSRDGSRQLLVAINAQPAPTITDLDALNAASKKVVERGFCGRS